MSSLIFVCIRKGLNWLTSIIFLFVSDSWGSLYSVYLRRTLSMSVLAYWYSLLLELKIINAISQSHNTDNSYAFFITPNFLLLKVTWEEKRKKSLRFSKRQNYSNFINFHSFIYSFLLHAKKIIKYPNHKYGWYNLKNFGDSYTFFLCNYIRKKA